MQDKMAIKMYTDGPQLIAHAKGNISMGNDQSFLIKLYYKVCLSLAIRIA